MNLYQINPSAPAWKLKCTLGNEVPQRKASNLVLQSHCLCFLWESDLELIKNVSAAISLRSLPQPRCYTSKTVLENPL